MVTSIFWKCLWLNFKFLFLFYSEATRRQRRMHRGCQKSVSSYSCYQHRLQHTHQWCHGSRAGTKLWTKYLGSGQPVWKPPRDSYSWAAIKTFGLIWISKQHAVRSERGTTAWEKLQVTKAETPAVVPRCSCTESTGLSNLDSSVQSWGQRWTCCCCIYNRTGI